MEELCCLVDTPGLRVYHDQRLGWLYNQWLGVHNAASVRQAGGAICACLQAHPCTRILSDHSGLLGSWQDSVPWITQVYFERLAAQGIVYFAWVYNSGYYDRLAMQQVLQELKYPIVDVFKDVEPAYEWLRRCPAV